ncbi:hypothetical protein vseg_003044 [Gypsophila vaccaria]
MEDEHFIDRSKVRVLLCDNDSNCCDEVYSLLRRCSYQVIAVKSARQVINALNAEGPSIDIMLCEVDLPMKKGLKLLKYIMRDQELQRIPVIMMSTQDEVSLVVKCLRLGAADYLVKPLRSNEMLNLWTHMWRRRRMLGLAEKNIATHEFNLAASDPSDANTNSNTLFSDDTDDKSRRSGNPEMSVVGQQEEDSNKVTSEPAPVGSFDCRPGVPGISDRRTGQVVSFPRKNELKIGECSAFFTYVKSNTSKDNCQSVADVDINNNCEAVVVVDLEGDAAGLSRVEDKFERCDEHESSGNIRYENRYTWENNSYGDDLPTSTSVPESASMERSSTPSVSMGYVPYKSCDEGLSQVHMYPRNSAHFDVSGLAAHSPYPYYMPGMMNQVMMTHGTSSVMPHYTHLPHCPSHLPGMTPFSYYPLGMSGVPQGQLLANQQLPSYGNSPSGAAGLSKVDRREAALIKFRQKRKKRCFDKKVRYVNRKNVAERRPRVRGQFVSKVNEDPSPADLDDEDEYDEEDDD